MRRKPVLSHSPLLFPTIPAIVASVLVPAFFAQAQAQSVIPQSFEEDRLLRQQSYKMLQQEKQPDDKNAPTLIESGKFWGRPERFIHFEHEVEILKGATQVNADRASYSFLEDEVTAEGSVRMLRNGDCYNGDSVRMQLDSGAGNVVNPVYQLLRNNAQGKAERIDFLDEERSIVNNGTYSTCEGLNPDWYLRSETLNLDTGLDTGIAGKSVLYFMGTPILATPSLTFPLSSARHSGFLPPVVGASSKGGVEFALPYYFNIAPNRDLTLYPKLISRRGLQLGAEGRYLGETYRGETSIEGLANDRLTNSNRYALTSVHQQQLTPQLRLEWNLNSASDDNYPSDFSNSITKTAQRLLLRDVSLTYYGSFWNTSLRTTGYQVLQDVTATTPIALPYSRSPELQFHAEKYDLMGFDWTLDSTLTRFQHPTLVQGDRLVVTPQLSLPLIQPGYFVIPKISLHLSKYELVNPGKRQKPSYQLEIPTFSVDSGLIFERPSELFEKTTTQTLEPRIFYVNTPYHRQGRLPNFDSAIADFNFAQIFSPNRFTGQDRVGDANQVTLALISRFLEEDGAERLKLAIGQRFNFSKQRVTLDGVKNPGRSDLLLTADGRIFDTLSAETALQISQSTHQSVRATYGISWHPEPKKVLNLAYRFQRDTLEQVDLSGQWPLANRWYAVGRTNYSLMDKRIVDGLAGFEYKADCWSLRFVAQRFAIDSINSNTGFSIQLELNGLARLGVGNNPIEALKRNISGYQPISER